jgi:hypothetical protein
MRPAEFRSAGSAAKVATRTSLLAFLENANSHRHVLIAVDL